MVKNLCAAIDFFRNSIRSLKWLFLSSFLINFSTVWMHMLSKFIKKPAQKQLIFSIKASFERSLMRFSSHNRRIFACLSLIFLAVFFCTSFSNLHAETKDAEQIKQQRITEIQKKVMVLKLEREQLARTLKEDRKKESKEEMQSMHKMQTYRWHAAAEDLKDAEQIENKSNEKHKKIKEMDQQLYELEKEMDRLTGSGS